MTVLRPGVAEPVQLRAGISAEERRQLDEWIGLQLDQIGVVVEPAPDTPAARAGLVAGDEIQRAGERDLADWQDLIEVVQGAGDAPLQLVVRGDDGQRAVTLTPQHLLVPDLGFTTVARAALRETYRVESVGGAIAAGLVASADLIKQLYVTLKRLFTGDVAASNLGGIITISRVSYDQAQSGWARFFYFLALLSINLAFINVLPIPVLDGGHLLFLLIEKIKGSPVSARVLNYSQLLGLVFVVALMVYVTFNDIRRLF
jgi:regulator of sigma E protease